MWRRSLQWMLSNSAAVRFAIATAIAAGFAPCMPRLSAQTIVESGFETEMSAAERDKLYASLSHEVDELERHRRILKTVVRLVSPTVVHIEAEKNETAAKGYARNKRVEEAGSGVVVELKDKYYVLTNRHVIRDAQLADIKILFADDRTISPTKVWSDADTDIAVMAVSLPKLIPARVGNSDHVEVGDFVLAVGSPFGLSHSVTYGIISAKGRRELELGDGGVRYQDFLQTDAAINPGNSGGPLIDLRGEVIGINTAIASQSGGNEGIGFSIPINMVIQYGDGDRPPVDRPRHRHPGLSGRFARLEVFSRLGDRTWPAPSCRRADCRNQARIAGRGCSSAGGRRHRAIQRHQS
jgi:S1-C subfamily serine protease